MGDVLPFPSRVPDDRVELADALAGLAGHLEQVRATLGHSLSMLDRAGILPEIRGDLSRTAGRADDLADWLAVVRRQLPDLPPERLSRAVTPLIVALDCLDHEAHALLHTLPGRIERLMRRG